MEREQFYNDIWHEQMSAEVGALSIRGRHILMLAEREAGRLRHRIIGTEHLLLALITDGQSSAADVLAKAGVTTQKLRRAILAHTERGRLGEPQRFELAPEAREVVLFAIEGCYEQGRQETTPTDVLLSLSRRPACRGALILEGLGVRLDQLENLIGEVGFAEHISDGTKSNVVTCRVNDADFATIDTLVEVGIRSTRSEVAAWLIHAGITAHSDLCARAEATVAEIRRLRDSVQRDVLT